MIFPQLIFADIFASNFLHMCEFRSISHINYRFPAIYPDVVVSPCSLMQDSSRQAKPRREVRNLALIGLITGYFLAALVLGAGAAAIYRGRDLVHVLLVAGLLLLTLLVVMSGDATMLRALAEMAQRLTGGLRQG
ncbi:hypothetical protein F9C11_00260 [Amycolatopsis sp. VS8301801F10]|uniref:hypothetical protein n=1 Tax=Amycolatopsis sp. VS8301801F10 TaxID=2652442 RepID=UPI0038FBFF44